MKRKKFLITALIFGVSFIFSGCADSEGSVAETTESVQTEVSITITEGNEKSKTTSPSEYETTIKIIEQEADGFTDDMTVHFIDVDQGDSTFIELPNGESMLIDAGETDQGDRVTTYINSQGYDELDYVVATHAHSDHIGGLPDVLRSLEVDNFYMTSAVVTTKIYEEMLAAVTNSEADVHSVMAGDVILDEKNLLIEVVAPVEIDENEQNNNSVVIKLTYGDNKFLFTGDAEKEEEDDIRKNIKCDVLKVGHHGSDTSSSANFLKKTEPSYAVISCGMNNSYGHPTDEILKRLYERNINVYITDMQGTIVFTSDGSDISVNVNPSEYIPSAALTSEKEEEGYNNESAATYVLNTSSKKIHYADCSSVDSMNESNKAFTDDYEQAIADGYTPCGRCKP